MAAGYSLLFHTTGLCCVLPSHRQGAWRNGSSKQSGKAGGWLGLQSPPAGFGLWQQRELWWLETEGGQVEQGSAGWGSPTSRLSGLLPTDRQMERNRKGKATSATRGPSRKHVAGFADYPLLQKAHED